MSSPAELLVIQQQKTGFALGKQFTEVAGKFGAARLYRGFPMTAGREALFTAGYLGLGPIAKASLQDNFPLLKENDGLALLAGGCAAGLVAGVLTHPLDTVKTRLQSDIAREVYKGPWAAAKVLWKEEGAAAFYKGFLPRCARLCGAVIILNKAGGILEEIIVDNNILAFGK
ncbi:hypothetical protein SARC_02431 [Sphaeroforma arctica JP610]|uniref:Uncharacterized protein n=1 Tax=Sphaeroforma arctica JP610 TaxID=667725 RepID=A0A0L0GAS9_9EUKA|nr:hypothetical protein SARC_02431 [Sphaeroforma arctica JP610]KNC85373.1 hypothetical protein SARC_02431 [Sphaeroforma arctica JP610]|eukprot:XP_014159275.1 hypothetical protein SARC_02431 [Sphaeroforma arctica JP610]